ncbi:MAG: hypothetical protein H2174_05830 [Vampirovibrio sp.]|nr:hypothetical protein [Vampirovibrio sp.]
MMNSSVITPPLETLESSIDLIDAVITVSPIQVNVTGSLQNLPVHVPMATSSVPDSFIDLFWQMTGAAFNRLKSLVKQGVSLWVEAFGAIATVQQLETIRATTTSYPTQVSPAFRLRNEDSEASLVSSLIAERRLNTAVQPLQTPEREAWLSVNQWSGLDDLFPVEPESTEDDLSQVEASSVVIEPEALVSTVVTANTILDALHEAYPITTPEEEACLKHPLIQRGREVKSSINELVDAYFA